jgi:hypothetical protein
MICYTLEDLDRVDRSVFELSAGARTLLTKEYPANFGFLICKLKMTPAHSTSHKYEPFAYSHCLHQSSNPRTGLTRQMLFLPTKHYHPHTRPSSSRTGSRQEDADWDHQIVVLNHESGLVRTEKWEWLGAERIPSVLTDLQAITGAFKPCHSYAKCTLSGSHENVDMYITVR